MAQIFHSLISVEEASARAAEAIGEVSEPEMVKIGNSLNRVIYEPIMAPVDSPPYDRSTVDGYAVRAKDVEGAEDDTPVELTVTGSVKMGKGPAAFHGEMNCLKIPTGGYVPAGSDSVVMVEHTRSERNLVKIYRSVRAGENIARAGSDIPKGDIIARRGTRIGPREISALAALGISTVKVYRKLRIGIMSTGDELMKQGEKLSPGRLYESNGHSVKALLDSYGVFDSAFLGIIPDKEENIRKSISEAVENYDVVVVSGSTSAGEGDMVYRILGEFQPGIVFHGLQIKPGMPSLMAVHGGKVIIGLPGFPVSAIMVFRTVFLPPLLEAAHYDGESVSIDASLAVKIHLDIGKLNLVPVSIVDRNGYVAYPMLGGSGSISRVLRSDGYLSIQGDRKFVEQGERVRATLFDNRITPARILFAGPYDPVLENLFRSEKGVKIINTNSRQALEAVKRGEADIAAINIFDRKSGTYNGIAESPELSRISFLAKGFRRELGLMIAKGNPLEIRKFSDITGKSARFVNLERSSGTRSYVDFITENEKIDPAEIRNYDYEVGSVNAVASTIESGKADAGIGTRNVSDLHDLDFIPLSYEDYDFVIRKESREKLAVFLEKLRSREFREMLNRPASGYRL